MSKKQNKTNKTTCHSESRRGQGVFPGDLEWVRPNRLSSTRSVFTYQSLPKFPKYSITQLLDKDRLS